MGNVHVIKGVKIYVYSRDHNPPHIHAIYAEHEGLIRISDAQIFAGYLPKNQLKLVQEWLSDTKIRKQLTAMFHQLNPDLWH